MIDNQSFKMNDLWCIAVGDKFIILLEMFQKKFSKYLKINIDKFEYYFYSKQIIYFFQFEMWLPHVHFRAKVPIFSNELLNYI
jgi:hypothetical protein